ncbi:hypothetical protein EYF80_060778 [Liparis tanakae]|uniref:Uncharacterized protein n=1 Tax=Liparis tanakae TaxID=230148 RepID=A0A4Z2EKT2_9TELE|nr:hypothetical protein EYF80_060778 [Liparis tanakae]
MRRLQLEGGGATLPSMLEDSAPPPAPSLQPPASSLRMAGSRLLSPAAASRQPDGGTHSGDDQRSGGPVGDEVTGCRLNVVKVVKTGALCQDRQTPLMYY